ncbi:hypothetical protein [Vibrio phage vB_VhaP_VH-5]|uniref:Uncharacterized protein n=1 Tax=Vibrio phage vB_VhaP_VH-5 TaxID=2660694 RepID=A0A5Q2W9W2_9CAUD|nr:hypothetical protein [Vibrio phage vB_VhaP_VH-5]
MSNRKNVLKRRHVKAAPKPIKQNPPINHKTDQVVRSIYFGYAGTDKPLVSSPVKGNALMFFEPESYVVVGIADARGYRFTPATNSALISLGYHPTAVLTWLSQLHLNGAPVVQAQGDELVAVHAAVVQCARDVVMNYEKLGMVKGKPRVLSKPILEHYKAVGKHPLFA